MQDTLKHAFEHLSKPTTGWNVSIYIPTHRSATEARKGYVRYKNLLSKAQDELVELGLKKEEARSLLGPANEFLEHPDIWQTMDRGLATFITNGFFEFYRLSEPVEPLLVVGRAFHIKPLLALEREAEDYFLLTLSQKMVRLFRASSKEIEEIDLPAEVPQGSEEALRFDDPETQLQYYAGPPQGGQGDGNLSAIFHGHGGGADWDHKKNVLRYFRAVDRGLHKVFRGENIPLLLGGVDYLLPIYRKANTYPHLVDVAITGNLDKLQAEKLCKQGWELMEPIFAQDVEEELTRYKNLVGTGKAADDLEEVVKSAHDGRVDTLFVVSDAHSWGSWDAEERTLTPHEDREPGDLDLLDIAARETVAKGGRVFAIEAGQRPGESDCAAILRF